MRFTASDGKIEVILSRRNLLAGLHKLEMPGSARELQCYDGPEGTTLHLFFEDDDEHYNHPDRTVGQAAGPMHPDTEKFIASPPDTRPDPLLLGTIAPNPWLA